MTKNSDISSNEIYRLLFENSPDAIFVCDLSGKIIEANPAAEQMLEYSEEELHHLNLQALAADFESLFGELPGIGESSAELKMKAKDGTLFPVEIGIKVFPINNSEKRVFVSAKDITELKLRQMLIREASEFGKIILKSAPVGIGVYNSSGDCILVNDAFTTIIGVTKTEIIKHNFHNISSWREYGIYELAIQVLERGKTIHKEIFAKSYEGKSTWVDITLSSFKVNDEVNLLIMIDDISVRKQTEELLKISEEKFRSSVESMTDPFAIFEASRDADNKITDFSIRYINKAGINIITKESQNISARSLFEFFTQKSSSDIFPEVCKVVETGEPLTSESIVYDDSGNYIKHAVQINAVKLGDGFVINWRDITEHKIIEKELTELNKNKDKFFSIIAHDLRSPFHSILGMTEFLAEDPEQFSAEEKKEIFQASNQHVKTVFELLENLLQWASNQAEHSFNPEMFYINEIITQEIDLFMPTAKEKAISIKFEKPPHNVAALADKKMIGTVMRNLISNAIKFSYPGGDIKIKLAQEADKLSISVSDSGLGISSANITKILHLGEKFTTLGTNKERGSGFGLVLVKDFLEKNKSELVIESTPGRGSTFKFELPAA